MTDKNSLRDEIKGHNSKLKDMTFKQKCSHIWEYYKVQIVGAVIITIAIIFSYFSYQANNYKTVFNAVVIDAYITGAPENLDALTLGFTEYLGIDGERERIDFNYDYSLVHKTGDQDPYFSSDKISAMATTHTLDGYISNKSYINFFSDEKDSFFLDLSTVLTSEELDTISDSLLYYTDINGNRIPYAVDLSSTFIKQDTDLSLEQPCYGIVITAPRPENGANFIRYAFGL